MRRGAVILWVFAGCAAPSMPPSTDPRHPPRPFASSTISYVPCAPGKESVKGVVRFNGKYRPPHGFFDKDQIGACESHDPAKVARAEFSIGPAGELANVFISVTSGLDGRRLKPPRDPVYMTNWCIFLEPRVVAVRTGQPIVVRNGEKKFHSIVMCSNHQPQFGRGHAGEQSETRLDFAKPEIGIRLLCNVHAWERAWVHVVDHPYFAVTGADGGFEIAGLPPGEYEILAWHERFKEVPCIAKVKVQAGETSTLDFTFEAPAK